MSVLQKPIITEKATSNSELQNTYWFEVDPNANKIQIKQEVELAYGVAVDSVRTMNVYPKVKTRFTKAGVISGRKKFTKKAIVKVVDGDMIDLYSNL